MALSKKKNNMFIRYRWEWLRSSPSRYLYMRARHRSTDHRVMRKFVPYTWNVYVRYTRGPKVVDGHSEIWPYRVYRQSKFKHSNDSTHTLGGVGGIIRKFRIWCVYRNLWAINRAREPVGGFFSNLYESYYPQWS